MREHRALMVWAVDNPAFAWSAANQADGLSRLALALAMAHRIGRDKLLMHRGSALTQHQRSIRNWQAHRHEAGKYKSMGCPLVLPSAILEQPRQSMKSIVPSMGVS